MRAQKNVLEWLVFAVSAILLAGVAGTLVIAGMRSGDTPPSLVIETGAPEANGGTFRIPIRVRNVGDRTAEEARIEVELLEKEVIVERAGLTIPFVPKQSMREGWVAFRRDPRCCTVLARAAFNEP
jgi:uncharacterized protein (TIGR02588 family)